LIVGSIIGGGAFALPQTISASAQTGAIIISWLITSVGMIGLVFVFRQLNQLKPELSGGIYSYAKTGFGNFIGFIAAWGYWLSAWLGNVSYAVLMFGALGFFIPHFGDGNTLWAVVGASIYLWTIHFIILKGVKEAALVNVVTTIAKIIPIIAFIILCCFAVHWSNFKLDFWGEAIGPVFGQLKSTMLVTLWVFIGIEGAVVVSGRAKKRSDVGKATILGLVFTLTIYILITFLSIGAVGQPNLADMKNPSMAYVLEAIVGEWGAMLVNIGLVISLAGAWLGWTLLCAELPDVAAKDAIFPKFLAKENKNKSPMGSLWFTNSLIQLFLIVVLYSKSTYLSLLKLATSCILLPYLFSSLFALKLLFVDNAYLNRHRLKLKNGFFAILGTVYAIFLVFAAGLHYLLLSSILYMLGVPFYVWARIASKQKVFTKIECCIFCIILIATIFAVYLLMR